MSITTTSDNQQELMLLERWRVHADSDAICQIFTLHACAMWHLSYQRSGNAADADDCVQQACAKGMR